MDFLFIGIIGLIIGSFLNVCIYRIPREESISYPPSHCGNCNHKLGPLDLIPLISYVFLKGRCRYCREKISVRYPLIEGFNCILYLMVYMKYGFSVYTIKFCILCSLLIVIGCIDYFTQDVYISTTAFGVVTGIIFIAVQIIIYKEGAVNLILGGLIGAVIIGLIVFLTGGMGEGDIEIAGVCGLFLGTKLILLTLFISIIIGGVIGIIIIALKLKNKKDSMAFGPCIAFGAIVAMLFGNELIDIYLKLFI
ncbi:A24 family peptidase [uncultured Clostridium sp.]|uniref:prepilin peptidase n=1 Tax=uncultured Clostridium sp. TaxID=59620 RepID=UPI0025DECBAB|nr:A24 family peptidase [uncultured Clostridium sp.]